MHAMGVSTGGLSISMEGKIDEEATGMRSSPWELGIRVSSPLPPIPPTPFPVIKPHEYTLDSSRQAYAYH